MQVASEIAQVALEAARIGVIAAERAAPIHHAIDRTERTRLSAQVLDEPGRGFLVRHGQIYADDSERMNRAKRRREIFGRDAKRRVRSVHAKRRVGGVVHCGRLGMSDGIAKNRRDRGVAVNC